MTFLGRSNVDSFASSSMHLEQEIKHDDDDDHDRNSENLKLWNARPET